MKQMNDFIIIPIFSSYNLYYTILFFWNSLQIKFDSFIMLDFRFSHL